MSTCISYVDTDKFILFFFTTSKNFNHKHTSVITTSIFAKRYCWFFLVSAAFVMLPFLRAMEQPLVTPL